MTPPLAPRASLLGRAVARWIAHQDEATARALGSTAIWAGVLAGAGAALALAALPPAEARALLGGVRPLDVAVAALPMLLCGVALCRAARRNRAAPPPPVVWVLALGYFTCAQLLAATLVARSSAPHATAALSSLLVLTAACAGHVLRATPREPFVALGTAAAVVVACAQGASADQRVALAVSGALGGATALLLGTLAVRRDRARAEAAMLREAVAAQMLDEQEREARRLFDTLTAVLGQHHDINNALMTVLLEDEALATLLREAPDPLPRAEVARIAGELADGHKRIGDILAAIRRMGRGTISRSGDPAAASVGPVVDAAVAAARARFPAVRFAVRTDAPDGGAPLRVFACGGALTLRRVLENLLTNACEGDGRRGATRVEVAVDRDATTERVRIAVRDDGPGFSPAQLRGPIEGFATTKPYGTGLGLYTCERLVRASGGALLRTAAEGDGGACVIVLLPEVPASTPPDRPL